MKKYYKINSNKFVVETITKDNEMFVTTIFFINENKMQIDNNRVSHFETHQYFEISFEIFSKECLCKIKIIQLTLF